MFVYKNGKLGSYTRGFTVFKSWKNIPDLVLSVDTSISQQLINIKTYRMKKLQKTVDETNYLVCSNDQERVLHILYSLVAPKWHSNCTRTGMIEV